jgi:hypothetical protein
MVGLRPETTEYERIGIVKNDRQTQSQLAMEPCRLIYDAECRLVLPSN